MPFDEVVSYDDREDQFGIDSCTSCEDVTGGARAGLVTSSSSFSESDAEYGVIEPNAGNGKFYMDRYVEIEKEDEARSPLLVSPSNVSSSSFPKEIVATSASVDPSYILHRSFSRVLEPVSPDPLYEANLRCGSSSKFPSYSSSSDTSAASSRVVEVSHTTGAATEQGKEVNNNIEINEDGCIMGRGVGRDIAVGKELNAWNVDCHQGSGKTEQKEREKIGVSYNGEYFVGEKLQEWDVDQRSQEEEEGSVEVSYNGERVGDTSMNGDSVTSRLEWKQNPMPREVRIRDSVEVIIDGGHVAETGVYVDSVTARVERKQKLMHMEYLMRDVALRRSCETLEQNYSGEVGMRENEKLVEENEEEEEEEEYGDHNEHHGHDDRANDDHDDNHDHHLSHLRNKSTDDFVQIHARTMMEDAMRSLNLPASLFGDSSVSSRRTSPLTGIAMMEDKYEYDGDKVANRTHMQSDNEDDNDHNDAMRDVGAAESRARAMARSLRSFESGEFGDTEEDDDSLHLAITKRTAPAQRTAARPKVNRYQKKPHSPPLRAFDVDQRANVMVDALQNMGAGHSFDDGSESRGVVPIFDDIEANTTASEEESRDTLLTDVVRSIVSGYSVDSSVGSETFNRLDVSDIKMAEARAKAMADALISLESLDSDENDDNEAKVTNAGNCIIDTRVPHLNLVATTNKNTGRTDRVPLTDVEVAEMRAKHMAEALQIFENSCHFNEDEDNCCSLPDSVNGSANDRFLPHATKSRLLRNQKDVEGDTHPQEWDTSINSIQVVNRRTSPEPLEPITKLTMGMDRNDTTKQQRTPHNAQYTTFHKEEGKREEEDASVTAATPVPRLIFPSPHCHSNQMTVERIEHFSREMDLEVRDFLRSTSEALRTSFDLFRDSLDDETNDRNNDASIFPKPRKESISDERWYAHVSHNADGVYYVQPSTGAITKKQPKTYLDTATVRREAEDTLRKRHSGWDVDATVGDNLTDVRDDHAEIELVSPVGDNWDDGAIAMKRQRVGATRSISIVSVYLLVGLLSFTVGLVCKGM